MAEEEKPVKKSDTKKLAAAMAAVAGALASLTQEEQKRVLFAVGALCGIQLRT